MRYLNIKHFLGNAPVLLLAAVLIAAGCTPAPHSPPSENGESLSQAPADTEPGALSIAGVVPLSGEPVRDRIVLFFDAPVAMASEEAGAQPFIIDPPVAGQFRVDDNFASFEAHERFEKDVLYTVELSPDLVSTTGSRIPEESRTHCFASYLFEPRRMWEIEEQPDRVVLGMLFPAPVDLTVLRDHLIVEDLDGQPIECGLEESEEGAVRLIFEDGLPAPVRIRVLEGLSDASGTMALHEDRLFAYPQEPFFQVADVQWGEFKETAREIVLRFSKTVPAGVLRDGLSIVREDTEHQVPFEVISEGEALEHSVENRGFAEAAIVRMMDYHWPGNVRELRNLVENAILLSGDAPISAEDLEPYFEDHELMGRALPVLRERTADEMMPQNIERALILIFKELEAIRDRLDRLSEHFEQPKTQDLERRRITAALERYDGDKRKAAEELGVSIRTLYRWLKKYRL